MPETFLALFPVSVKSLASAYGRRRVGLRPTPKIPAAREKNLWYPGYGRPFSPPESYFSGGEKRRPEMRVFASYDAKEFNKKTVCYIYSGAKL